MYRFFDRSAAKWTAQAGIRNSAMMSKIFLCAFLFILLVVTGCGPSRSVQRVASDSQTDLSGKWNETDSRLTAETMIPSMLGRNWVTDFMQAKGKKPTVIVGTLRNQSSEHIQTDMLVKDIERELVNSGKITFVANKQERSEIREERTDQQSNATEESAKKLASELGADFMLKGSIKDQVDRLDGTESKFYQVDLELIDMENNTKVWIDTKKIKKMIEKKGASW